MKSLTESINNISPKYHINQNDLNKVTKILTDKNIFKDLDEEFKLPSGVTQYYCEEILSNLSDPEWYENFKGDGGYPNIPMKEIIGAQSWRAGVNFVDELYHDKPLKGSKYNQLYKELKNLYSDLYWGTRRMPEKVLDMCYDILR